MKQTKQQTMQQLYDRLREVSEIPINEQKEIFIKQSLVVKEKLKVLTHEYSHYVHLTHYFNQESRAECELIAIGAAFSVCVEYGLNISKDVDLTKFSDDAETVARMTAVIQTVARHILARLNQG